MNGKTDTDKMVPPASPLTSAVRASQETSAASWPAGTSKVACASFLTASAMPSEELTLTEDDIFIDGQGIVRFVDRTIVAVRKRSCVDATRVRQMADVADDPGKVQVLKDELQEIREGERPIIKERARFSDEQIAALKKPMNAPTGMGAAEGGGESAIEPLSIDSEPLHADSPGNENEVPPVAICPCDVTVETG